MTQRTDITTVEYDLAIADGDLCIGAAEEQNQRLILATNKGDWKATPTVGVGIMHYIESATSGELAREIRTQLTADGMTVSKVNITDGNIDVEAYYED